jgi:hypothetical protein
LNEEKNTLASQIQFMDTQINLTELQINQNKQQTEVLKKEIKELGSRITELDKTTNKVSSAVAEKINQMYRKQRVSNVYTFISANNLSSFLRSIQYLQKSQKNDRELLLKLQNTKVTFKEQRGLREEKEQELTELSARLETYKLSLASQQQAKEHLLEVTKNDEKKYQQILAQTRAEFEAIRAIVSGGGTETEVREVVKGNKIASVIPTASCNSGGPHLHFIVKEGSGEANPFSYLKSVDSENCSGSSCGSWDGDAFNPSGSWDWPLNPKIILTQGYGETWAVRNTWVRSIYSFHNGIDIQGSGYDVVSVADGTLYSGAYTGGGGCALPYVMVKHKDSNITTYYLHVYTN